MMQCQGDKPLGALFLAAAVALLVLGAAGIARAEDSKTAATQTALHLLLDGPEWRIAADVDNAGRDAGWCTAPRPDAVAASVPGIIQEPLPGYHGVAWYWRPFDAPKNPDPQGRYLVRFNAVDYLADVWLNGKHLGGHEGGETPFTLDATAAILPGAANLLAVRVLNPTDKPIDGIVLAETPHRNKGVRLTVGGSYNSGGITESVELLLVPHVRIKDVFVQPDWRTGKVRIEVTLENTTTGEVKGLIAFRAAPAATGGPVAATTQIERALPPGETMVVAQLEVANHHLWDVQDPYLYRADVVLTVAGAPSANGGPDCVPRTDAQSVRFGFRDFRVERGYFRLNGKRIFLRSTHTGNHCPIGQVVAPECARDLLRKDLLFAKSCGLNCVRFISGISHPYQLDMCDEIGLMVYQEDYAAWLLGDSPKMAERFDNNLREMLLRDRNHPSIVIWGLLNEMPNGPVVQHAIASLPLLRSLDRTRLVLLQSGRWDGLLHIGSVCNPGNTSWECVWGEENPDNKTPSGWGAFGGYITGAGDAHVYPGTPHTPEIEAGIRNLGKDSKPVFLSEYGIGSLMNAIREGRYYEQYGANPALDDYQYFKKTEEKLTADWRRLGFEGVYPFPEDMLRASQRMHCRQRLLGFDLIRSNPKICGYNITGMLDHGFTGEGLWTYWREFKPGIAETLQDGLAPVRWCLFASSTHAYAGRPIRLEAVLANEDVLKPGEYPVALRVVGPKGIVWEKQLNATIPRPAPEGGQDAPLAVSVFAGEVTLTEPGDYTFAACMLHGGAPAGGRLTLHVSSVPKAAESLQPMAVLGLAPKVCEWLAGKGVESHPFGPTHQRETILVGTLNDATPPEQRAAILRHVAQGSAAVFLDPAAFKRGADNVAWLPLKNKGKGTHFSDWLYHKECVAKPHRLFDGLQANGIMDWDYYGPVISHFFFEGQDTPDDVAAAAFAVCHSSRPDGYAAGTMLAAYKFGEGRIILNTFNLLPNIDAHPAADRLLLGLIHYAHQADHGPQASPPPNFEQTLKELGY